MIQPALRKIFSASPADRPLARNLVCVSRDLYADENADAWNKLIAFQDKHWFNADHFSHTSQFDPCDRLTRRGVPMLIRQYAKRMVGPDGFPLFTAFQRHKQIPYCGHGGILFTNRQSSLIDFDAYLRGQDPDVKLTAPAATPTAQCPTTHSPSVERRQTDHPYTYNPLYSRTTLNVAFAYARQTLLIAPNLVPGYTQDSFPPPSLVSDSMQLDSQQSDPPHKRTRYDDDDDV